MIIDWHTILGLFSISLLLGTVPFYIHSVFKGDTRPNPVSWFGWALLGGIASAAQFTAGASWSLVVPLVTTINCIIVILLALKVGKAQFTQIDGLCLVLGFMAIIGWVITDEPLVAIVLTIITDTIFTLPTILKTYTHPKSEPTMLWGVYVSGAVLAIIASRFFDIYNLLYPLYTVLAGVIIWLLSLRKFKRNV